MCNELELDQLQHGNLKFKGKLVSRDGHNNFIQLLGDVMCVL